MTQASVEQVNRLISMDIIRGFAVLGLPLMNIVSFALPYAAYFNPNAIDAQSFGNYWVYSSLNLLANQKFLGLFCILFGASVALVSESRERRGEASAPRHFGRMVCLFVVGLAHFWFVWWGDILTAYAIVGFFLYFFINLSKKTLAVVGLLSLALALLSLSSISVDLDDASHADRAAIIADYTPTHAQNLEQITKMRGSYDDVMHATSREDVDELSDTPQYDVMMLLLSMAIILKIFGLMIGGVLMFKAGMFQLSHHTNIYRNTGLFALFAGAALSAYALWQNYQQGWTVESIMNDNISISECGNIVSTFAYALLLMWIISAFRPQSLIRHFAPAGRVALTLYISQSLICAWLFYGYGAGLFASLTRLQLLGVAVLIALVQMWLARLWLRYFNQGPLESLLRCITYFKVMPIK